MRRILLIIVLCFLAVALTGCKKARLRAQLKELMSSTIVLPEKITCVYNGDVFPMPDSLRNSVKLIVFVDSTECNKCRIDNFVRYDDFFEAARITQSFNVFLMISPRKAERATIEDHLQNLMLPYPVYMDIEHRFTQINPRIKDFRAMTVDGSGRVLLVGDPAYNSKIRTLFSTLFMFNQSLPLQSL